MFASASLIAKKFLTSLHRKSLGCLLESCAEGIDDILFDRRCHVKTLERISDRKLPAGPAGLAPTKTRRLKNILHELPIKHSDFSFLDLGSGRGRALLIASEFPFRRVIGVEVLPELHAIARDNIRTYRSSTQMCKTIQLICGDASLCPIPSGQFVLFLSNPFEQVTLSKVMGHVAKSLYADPRRVYLVYHNPVCHDLVLQSRFELIRMSRFYAIYQNRLATSVSKTTIGDVCGKHLSVI